MNASRLAACGQSIYPSKDDSIHSFMLHILIIIYTFIC